MSKRDHKAYYAAQEACQKFQAELVRQFGRNAGTMRYYPNEHDAETSQARVAYQRAAEKLHNAARA